MILFYYSYEGDREFINRVEIPNSLKFPWQVNRLNLPKTLPNFGDWVWDIATQIKWNTLGSRS